MKQITINQERPLFLVGAKRSGTTLMRKIFNAHSEITIPPPSSFYRYIRSYVHTYGDLRKDGNILELISDCLNIPMVKAYWHIKETPEEILDLLPERTFAGVIATLFRIYANKFGSSIWGSKIPTNVFWLREIAEDFPRVRLLFIYRDGRDASLDQAEISWGPMNLYTACIAWKSHIDAMREAKKVLSPGSYYEIYYEEFIKEPVSILKAICSYFEIDYDPGMLKYYEHEPEEYVVKDMSFHKLASKPITADYIGIYKKLSLSDRQLQSTLLSETLQDLGYRVEDEKREIDFWERERYLDEDRNGANYIETIEYKNLLRKKRLERKRKRVY